MKCPDCENSELERISGQYGWLYCRQCKNVFEKKKLKKEDSSK